MTEPVIETTQLATAETELTGESGIILVDQVPAVLTQLSRGDTVEILGEQENCYIVDSEKGQGLLEKRLVRTSGEANYETWTGYLYEDPVRTLQTNTEVTVIGDLGYYYLIEIEGEFGMMRPDEVSRWKHTSSSGSSNVRQCDVLIIMILDVCQHGLDTVLFHQSDRNIFFFQDPYFSDQLKPNF